MRYTISYSCLSHVGKLRNNNQDNFICDGCCMPAEGEQTERPLQGVKTTKERALFGVFDGLGGEAYGEVASYIAAVNATDLRIGRNAPADLLRYCTKANEEICKYAQENGNVNMGTTAAMLAFTERQITLCNIGDSKVFRYYDGGLEQVSRDHVAIAAYGVKPPLSQNLGIPTSEMIIEPYVACSKYSDGEIFLLCSDGLTDMVTTDEIASVLGQQPIQQATETLLDKALENGGRDNITIILCEVKKKPLFGCRDKKCMEETE